MRLIHIYLHDNVKMQRKIESNLHFARQLTMVAHFEQFSTH